MLAPASASATSKQIVLIRHGQSQAQACRGRAERKSPEMLDCPITRAGAKQAEEVKYISKFGRPELIVVSPLTRALQTACIIFKGVEGVPIVAHPACAELDSGSGMPENTRRPLAQVQRDRDLANMSLFQHVDWGLVERLEEGLARGGCGGGADGAATEPTSRRGRGKRSKKEKHPKGTMSAELKEFLIERPEKHIAVVCHCNFIADYLGEHGGYVKNCVPIDTDLEVTPYEGIQVTLVDTKTRPVGRHTAAASTPLPTPPQTPPSSSVESAAAARAPAGAELGVVVGGRKGDLPPRGAGIIAVATVQGRNYVLLTRNLKVPYF